MTRNQTPGLAQSLAKLEIWFRMKLSAEQRQIYLSELCHISNEAMADIVKNYINEFAPTPSKFPTINNVKEQWRIRQQRHKAVTKVEFEKCDYCISTGFIFFREYIAEIPYEKCGRCPKCKNWQNSVHINALPVVFKEDLEAKGIEVWPYEITYNEPKPAVKQRSLKLMADQVGDRI